MCSAIKSTHWALNANYNIFLCLDLLFSFVKFFLVLFKKIFFYCTYFLSFYFLSLVTWSIGIFYFWLIIHISKFFWFYFCCLLFKLPLNLGDRTSFMISWIFTEKKSYIFMCVYLCACVNSWVRNEGEFFWWVFDFAMHRRALQVQNHFKLNCFFEKFFRPPETMQIWAINWCEEWLVGIIYRIFFPSFWKYRLLGP